jgi:hypothetical protein
VLVVISTAQLTVGLAGLLVAIRQGRSFEIFRWRGDPEHVVRESWSVGTGLSAPVVMLVIQAAATAELLIRPSRRATGALGALGAMMTVGCLIENRIRNAIRTPGADPIVAVVGGAGFALAMAMAVLGVRGSRRSAVTR